MNKKKQGFQHRFSLWSQKLLSCTGTLSMAFSKLVSTAKIILLTSVVCDNLNDRASAVVPDNFCLYFRCRSDCFLPEHAVLCQGTGQVGCIKGSHLKSLPSPPFLLLPLCPQVFVEPAGNGSLGLQHHPNLGCSNSACFEGPQQKVC